MEKALNFRIDKDIYKWVKKEARRSKTSMSGYIRTLLTLCHEAYLEEKKQQEETKNADERNN